MEHPLTVYLTANTLISSLGFGTQENSKALRAYRSGIHLQQNGFISDAPLLAGCIDSGKLKSRVQEANLTSFTRLEQLFILTIQEILSQSGAKLTDPDCGLLLSTTKGNIDLLDSITRNRANPTTQDGLDLAAELSADSPAFLWKMGERIGHFFQSANQVEIVSNACISGVSALIIAKRWLETGRYKRVIVAGGDVLSHFITSGFLSFKSISSDRCRPYDSRRDGLNLGEACGAILLETKGTEKDIILSGGAISNDANHISGPSRTGDGLYFAIHQAMEEANLNVDDISFVNAHGTATVYNDEMESKAIQWAGLSSVPVNSLKPYFGHTLGASGIIETIICMQQLKENTVLGTLGFETLGVPMALNVSAEHQTVSMKSCIKTASGFGGCNAAIALTLPAYQKKNAVSDQQEISVTETLTIEQGQIHLNGSLSFSSGETATAFPIFIREAFKNLGESNMKFYKMDDLCKLGYVAAGYLLKDKVFLPQEIGILLANTSSSLDTDCKHQAIITKDGDVAASPAVFVYTLPNVVAGEICIRHKIQGENTFFICRQYDEEALTEYAQIVMKKGKLKACIIGWCELLADSYKAEFKLIETSYE